MNVIIIAINWEQNSTASLMFNGEIKDCASEERFSKKYFEIDYDIKSYSYMTNCISTTKRGKIDLAAATHPYDETCRPQIITKGQNDDFEDLIMKFGEITGIHALLNTSFNLHGKPIVNSIDDAFNIFQNSNLDGLLLPNQLILKKYK